MSSSAVRVPAKLPPPKPDHSWTRRPESKIAQVWWRARMWFESTFALSMLEPWEKIMLVIIFALLFYFLASGILNYLPHHLRFLKRRAVYYLMGQEGDERALLQWLGLAGDVTATLHKEL